MLHCCTTAENWGLRFCNLSLCQSRITGRSITTSSTISVAHIVATRLYFFFRSPMFHLGGPDSLRDWFDRNPPCSQKSNKHHAKRTIKVPCCTQCAATRCTSTIGHMSPSDTRGRHVEDALRAIRARSTFQSSQILDGSSSSVLLIRSVLRRLRLVAPVSQALSPTQT